MAFVLLNYVKFKLRFIMNNEMILVSKLELVTLLDNAIKSAIQPFTAALNNPPIQSDNQLLTQQETCKLLNITESTLIQWKKENRIPYKKIGKRVYYSKQAIMNLI